MNRFVLAFVAALVSLGASVAWAETRVFATLYKNPSCKCCDGYAAHLRENGFDVRVVESANMTAIHRENGVPEKLEGCHVTVIGGYVVEGHVPASSVKRLLAEKPNIKGISLPGMPAGSPGMSGVKEGPFTILSITGQADEAPVFGTE